MILVLLSRKALIGLYINGFVHHTNIAGVAQMCQTIIILKKNPFNKTNFNLQYFN
jgi:hypothetical protein